MLSLVDTSHRVAPPTVAWHRFSRDASTELHWISRNPFPHQSNTKRQCALTTLRSPLIAILLSFFQVEDSSENSSGMKKFMHIIGCFMGLQFSYLTWGLLQEKIMTQKYQNTSGDSQLFTNSQFLVSIRFEKQKVVKNHKADSNQFRFYNQGVC